jgi:ribosomal protein S18 acetylase RimI-like enzyme
VRGRGQRSASSVQQGDPAAPAERSTLDAGRCSVRPATLDDLETVVSLRLALLREHGTNPVYRRLRPDAPERARKLFGAQLGSSHEVTFLAERHGDVVGILRCVESVGSPLLFPAQYGYVSSVYVVPEARRRGVLKALLAQAVRWCEWRGLPEMRLHSTSDGESANAAWTALGFEVVEHLRVKEI